MSNLKQELFEIDVYGFTILENVLASEEVEEMREVLIRLIEEKGVDRGDCIHISNLPTMDPVFSAASTLASSVPAIQCNVCTGTSLRTS